MENQNSPSSSAPKLKSGFKQLSNVNLGLFSSKIENPKKPGPEHVRFLMHHQKLHQQLLRRQPSQGDLGELITTPVFTTSAFNHAEVLTSNTSEPVFSQYGLLAGLIDALDEMTENGDPSQDPRLFFNVATPSSVFICGSQGSGKSHTLSCLLENCLLPSDASKLPRPLTGLVFHYDTFISDHGGSPCEAAFLSSDPNVNIRVLCSPTNVRTIQRTYHALNVRIEPLEIDQNDLNTKRMLELMAVNKDDAPIPLYMHMVYRILREMRMIQQSTGVGFDYQEFRRQIMDADLTPGQMGPLQQRLDTLESFMVKTTTSRGSMKGKKPSGQSGNDWSSKPGWLTIVDLSCPCVTPEGACSLFNICLSLFLEQDVSNGRFIALDEAHKYMNTSAEALTLTKTIISTVRLQRHLGTRVFISTQEPTISPALLDLSSVTIVHRFTSPDWLNTLKGHLAGAASGLLGETPVRKGEDQPEDSNISKASSAKQIFSDIVKLRVGEALLFSPSAVIGVTDVQGREAVKRLGSEYLKVRVRARLTMDGGKSVMAV